MAASLVLFVVNTSLIEVDQIDLAMAIDKDVAGVKVGVVDIVLMEASDDMADGLPCLLWQGFLTQNFRQGAYVQEALHDQFALIAHR